jgi:hypothetical protein
MAYMAIYEPFERLSPETVPLISHVKFLTIIENQPVT